MNESIKLLIGAVAEARGVSQVDVLEPLGPLSDELEELGLDNAAGRIRSQGTWRAKWFAANGVPGHPKHGHSQWREIVVNGEHVGIIYLPPRGKKWRAVTTDGRVVAREIDWQIASLHCIIGSP